MIDGGALILLQLHGPQSTGTFIAAASSAHGDTAYVPGTPELVDLSRVTRSDVSFDSLRRFARILDTELIDPLRPRRIAVFAPGDTIYGVSRMTTTLINLSPGGTTSEAFRTEAEALAWLGRTERRIRDLPGFDAQCSDLQMVALIT